MEHRPLIRLLRGAITEEVHRGSIVVCQGRKIVYSIGHTDWPTPMRSTAKPFQLLPLIQADGISKFKLTNSDIAVMVSSHNGEERHVNQIVQLLNRNGLSIEALYCGVHPPYLVSMLDDLISAGKTSLEQVHNNCSGKHAGMLLSCVLYDYEVSHYWKSSHALQRLILKSMSDILELKTSSISLALDGCGVPTFCVPLRNIALAYEKLAVSFSGKTSSALCTIGNAMIKEPFMVAGTGRIETEIMYKHQIVMKSGSSGIFCVSIPKTGMAVALKMESGSDDVSEVVVAEVLRQLGVLAPRSSLYQKNAHRNIHTWTGVDCGYYEPLFSIS
jgi:L-asparaginase II